MSTQIQERSLTPAEEQFHTSSIYPKPLNWGGPTWKIRNDYPAPPPGFSPGGLPSLPLPDFPHTELDAPWLKIDFRKEPEKYGTVIKEYCWEGNREAQFIPQDNHVRAWYHAPWMHASANGREPLKGLTFERPIPPLEFAKSQTHALQNWAIGFYNSPGASLFGYVWDDPNTPNWTQNLRFPEGTCVFKLLLTTASDKQVFTMKDSPSWPAVSSFKIVPTTAMFGLSSSIVDAAPPFSKVISPQPNPTVAPTSGAKREDHASHIRLIQVDWAVVDSRAPIGWVFGTFMYNGTLKQIKDPWDRLTLVGVQWGNDPQLDQTAYDGGKRPVESWINPDAEDLRKELGGKRPSWGYNGRLNGPADNFVSACASCHSVAQWNPGPMVQPGKLVKNKWIPENEKLTMTWFDNVKAGEPFSVRGALSCDYSLQLMIGFENYQTWLAKERTPVKKNVLFSWPGRRVVFRARPEDRAPDQTDEEKERIQRILDSIVVEREPARNGPTLEYTDEDESPPTDE
ncbi:hypothetical protein FRB96_008599 [Tulasnella sp. 330]|nr:hypothetical protein FRB96_008599 [Tulasnella sp. 330]KAG8879337.1 hypothetical protein FRB97_001765 [Tulasnella sp. 331]